MVGNNGIKGSVLAFTVYVTCEEKILVISSFIK